MNCTDCAWFNDIERPATQGERCDTCAAGFAADVAAGIIEIEEDEEDLTHPSEPIRKRG